MRIATGIAALKKWIFALVRLVYWLWSIVAGWCRGAGTVLFLSRASLLISGIAFVLLWLLPQGHEVGHKVHEGWFWFFLPVISCSLYSWLWARVILDQEFGRLLAGKYQRKSADRDGVGADIPINHLRFWTKWIPRLVGAIPSAGAAFAVYKAYSDPELVTPTLAELVLALAVCAGVVVFVWLRRPALAWLLGDGANPKPLAKRVRSLVVPSSGDGDVSSMPALMIVVLLTGFFSPLALLAYGLFQPARLGLYMGASTAFFTATTFAVSFLSFLIFAFNRARKGAIRALREKPKKPAAPPRRFHFPVITAGIVLSIALPLLFDAQRYAIRTLPAVSGEQKFYANQRPIFENVLAQWIGHNQPDAEGAYHMVIVATAGGALRAATWTGTILARLDSQIPGFHNRLFAVSGVSGGSLGTAAYLAAKREAALVKAGAACGGKKIDLLQRIKSGLAGDYLGPVTMGLLSNDLFLIGLGSLKGIETADRAEALETAWEQHWQATSLTCLKTENGAPQPTGPQGVLAGNFLELWQNAKPWPIVLFNGTHQQLGSRIVTSNIKTDGLFTDAYDFFSLRGTAIPVSTAVHNSARFSYISPGGRISQNNIILDGGYFENYGAETALEVVQRVQDFLERAHDARHRQKDNLKIRLHIIQIVSDPTIARSAFDKAGADNGKPHNRQPKSWTLRQWLGPVQGLLATRGARGLHAAKRLKDLVPCQSYYLFNMGGKNAKGGPALSWYMPGAVRDNLVRRLTEAASFEAQQIERLKNNLSGGKTDFKCN